MTKKLVRCTDFDEDGILSATPVSEGFIDGYIIAERTLEDVPIRIFHKEDGSVDAEVMIDPKLARRLHVNLKTVRQQVMKILSTYGFDAMSSTREMTDDDVTIFDDALPFDNSQAANFSPAFKLDEA